MTEKPLFQGWDLFLLRAPVRAVEDDQISPFGTVSDPTSGRVAYLDLLQRAVTDNRLMEGIRLASPDLSLLLERVASGNEKGLTDAALRRAALAILRYDIRMRSRPTPFGVFSGVACGRFDTAPKVEWTAGHSKRTYPDMPWLLGLIRRWKPILRSCAT